MLSGRVAAVGREDPAPTGTVTRSSGQAGTGEQRHQMGDQRAQVELPLTSRLNI